MDKRYRNVAALGLLTIVATITLVWGAYYLMGTPFWRNGLELAVHLENGAGLKRGDPVRVQGVQVGTVRSVDLTRDWGVEAIVRLRDDLVLPADTRATVSGDVFGAHVVQLVPGGSPAPLQPGDTVRGLTEPQLTDLAGDLGEQARQVLTRADSLLSPEAVRDLHETAGALPETARELRLAFEQLRYASAALRQTTQDIAQARPADQLNSTMAEFENSAAALTAAAQRMEQSIGTLGSVLAKIDAGDGTLGLLVNDSSLYLRMHETLREVGALATDIRERPQRYINLRIF